MKIAIISTHSFPIGLRGPITKTGDVVIMDLVRSLSEAGNEVSLFTPAGGHVPPNVKVFPMKCSMGKYPPSAEECELECLDKYYSELINQDIIHDFSVTKSISNNLNAKGKKTISTLMGGAWTHSYQPNNLIVWTESHRYRVLNGFTDYHLTPLEGLAGPNQLPLQKDARVVNGGVDTDFYNTSNDKKEYFLWMNRWHISKNYKMAIELAKVNRNLDFVLAGEHPNNIMFEYEKNCALEAIELSQDLPNVRIEFLPYGEDHHSEKIKVYQKAKALLYTVNFNEPFGLSQTEALACGTPVIGTNYGSVPEVITDGLTGFVCNNDLESFSNAINKVNQIDNKTCRDECVRRFDRSIMSKKYLTMYNEIINGSDW